MENYKMQLEQHLNMIEQRMMRAEERLFGDNMQRN
jgi:hypothetical protein